MAIVFCVAGFVSYSDRLILSALVDPLRVEFGISDAQVSLLQGAAFAIVYVLAGLPLGRLADRTNRIRLIIAGSTLWSLGTLACGLAPDFVVMCAARVVVGIGEAALAPAAVSMLSDAFPPTERGRAIGVFLMGMVIGGPAGIALGSALLDIAQHGGLASLPLIGALAPWRAVLVLVGAAGLLVPVLCLSVREPPRHEVGQARATVLDALGFFVNARWVFVPLYAGMALLSIGDYALFAWLPTSLSRRFDLEPGAIGALFGTITITTGVAAAVLGGALVDWARTRGPATSLFALSAIAAVAAGGAALVSAGTPVLVLTGLGLWNFASMAAGTAGIAIVQDGAPNEVRGVAISLVAFFNTLLGLGAGPTLVALITEGVYVHPASVGYAITAVALPGAMVAALLFAVARRSTRATSGR